MDNQKQIFCIAWFRRDQWLLLRQKAADPEIIEDTYDEWEKQAESLIQKLIAMGQPFKKIDIDIFELEAWCQEKGLPNDASARSQFAAEKGVEIDNDDYGFD